ncbi:MAG: hypothetical protein ACT4PW_09970 [Acidimicrobiia bacterium]
MTAGAAGGVPRPAVDPWVGVVGQPEALAQLRAAAAAPVHAYLLVGPRGAGKGAVARAFAASLLSDGLDGVDADRAVRLALAGRHPDLHVFERTGPAISADEARAVAVEASRSGVEGSRKVLVLVDFHLVREAGPILLKTIEEPPAGTVFVVLAEHVPAELVPIASRCVRVALAPVPAALVAHTLMAEGVEQELAAEVAGAAGGDVDRARLLATDPRFSLRRTAWRTVPDKLDGTGAVVHRLVAELRAMIDDAQEPLAARHALELAALAARVEQYGERGAGRRELGERHKRELRRLRTDELRFGLATLAGCYRDAVAAGRSPGVLVGAVDVIHDANEALVRNPNEALLLQSLFLELSALR